MESLRVQLFLLISVLLLNFLGVAQGQQNLTCTRQESLTPIHDFNLTAILDKWILFKSYASSSEDAVWPGYSCLESSNYYSSGSIIEYLIEDEFLNETGHAVVRDYLYMPSEENSAIWTKYLSIVPDLYTEESVYLHTDYDNWALQFTCQVRDDHMRETMIIWTRTRDPDPDTISFLQVLVQNYGFSLDNEIPFDQNCPQ